VKRLPPHPVLISLVFTSTLVWAVPRGILAGGAKVMAAMYDISPTLSPLTLLLLALAVSWVVLLDVTISREGIFLQNLGVGPRTLMGVAFGTVALWEIFLATAPTLLSLFAGS
jgi:hypothetical protein